MMARFGVRVGRLNAKVTYVDCEELGLAYRDDIRALWALSALLTELVV